MRTLLALACLAAALWAPSHGVRAQTGEDELVRRGAREYREACAVCHGRDGTGEGAMAELLSVPPPDLTRLAERNGGVFPFERVFRIIDGREAVEGHGTRDMPVWGRTFRREEAGAPGARLFGGDPELVAAGRIYALAKFLRAIQGGGEVPTEERERPRRHWPESIPVWPDLR
jgi:mono/diheme cytochrome c family protein